MKEKLYTAREVAEIFKVKMDTVYKWGRLGKIEVVTLGGAKRFKLPESFGKGEDE